MVDLRGQAANVARNLRYRPVGAVRELAAMVRYSVQSQTTADPVLAADWDVLVVLDACRADLFEEALDDGDPLPAGHLETRVSPGSATPEWLQEVFGGAPASQLGDIAYVSGNPFVSTELDASQFHTVERVWREKWDDDRGTLPPRPITDAAIQTGRATEADRLVVHYMQPHFPSLTTTDDDGVSLSEFGTEPMAVWDDLRFGRQSVPEVWDSYRENLDRVLGEVDALLSNLDADRAVVTADHGNAFGEHGVYGHPAGVDLPALREVPWYVTTGTDTNSREGATGRAQESAPDDESDIVAERLKDLGYKT